MEKDGVGLKDINLHIIAHFSPGWRKINSMCLCDHNIFISHCQGISKVNLESGECQLMVGLVDQPCVLTRFGMDILFKNQMKSFVWQLKPSGRLDLMAGSDKEEGSIDGPIKNCWFRQPMGICCRGHSVVYVCDAQTKSIKICSNMENCALFLDAMGSLYNAFLVHNKGSTYTVKSPNKAPALVDQCKDFLNKITVDIRSTTGITGTLNRPEGHVSAKQYNQ